MLRVVEQLIHRLLGIMSRVSDGLIATMACLSVHTTTELDMLCLGQIWESFRRVLLIDLELTARHSMVVLQEAAMLVRANELRILTNVQLRIHVLLQLIITLRI